MIYHGDYALESTVRFYFNTTQANGTPITLAGSPVVSLYSAGSTTETTTGVALTVDFDSRTGLHQVAVTATAANGFVAARSYHAVITTGTIDGISAVGMYVGSFSIQARYKDVNVVTWEGTDATDASANWEADGFPTFASSDSSTTTAIILTGDATPDDLYNGRYWLYVTEGTGIGQWAVITNNEEASGDNTITPDVALATAPDATSVIRVYPLAVPTEDIADIQARLPAALVSGRMDASVGAMAAGVVTASALATDAGAEIADAVWDEALSEPAGVFNWTTTRATFRDLFQWLGALSRNKITQTATTQTLKNNADNATLGTSTDSDDGTTATRGKWS